MRKKIRQFINQFGFDIVRFNSDQIGKDPLKDIGTFLHNDRPMIFDVGANIGQSIRKFRDGFPFSTIHAFEPSPTTFETLRQQASQFESVHLWNCALGSSAGQMTLIENSNPVLSSFLALKEVGWGTITRKTLVEVKTVDQFCAEEKIDRIDLLKSDTQGFDLEVFKGAEETIRANRIGLIYFEVIFSDMYENLPSIGELFGFLISRDFLLVSFYRFNYQKGLAGWTDALFVQRSYLPAAS